VTLHVGFGTFQPIRSDRIEDHAMHAEWVEISPAAVRALAAAKVHGGKIIAVGTTTLRALEGVALLRAEGQKDSSPSPWNGEGEREGERRSEQALKPFTGWINLFITPGFRFRIVDALLTNFHLPQSSLLILVSAFAAPGSRSYRGRDRILRAYRAALRKKYRFYSFGDAMFIQR
jgi:S-adenosylmethionine:tRNA ribosyltransferase-isomerase